MHEIAYHLEVADRSRLHAYGISIVNQFSGEK